MALLPFFDDIAVHSLIIEPRDLEAMLGDERLLLIDLCREETWSQAHLPGAIHVTPAELIAGTKPAVGKLPPPERLEALFSRLGYDRDQYIVAYDDEGGGWAGRFLWTLDVIGHQDMSLLNGGIVAWAAENRALSNETVTPQPTRVDLSIDRQYIATQAEVLANIEDPQTVVWDARSAAEYDGTRVVSARGGHIPGAINLDWLDVMDRDNYLRIRSDIAEVLKNRGITAEKNIITHCQTHHRSGLTYIVGKSLGYRVRAYDGSWSEWGNDPSTPVETQ